MSENLSDVREDSYLLEDVIVGQMADIPSGWYTNGKVRSGVCGLLKINRCKEEGLRLPMEAENMREWFCRELTAVQLAIHDDGSTSHL